MNAEEVSCSLKPLHAQLTANKVTMEDLGMSTVYWAGNILLYNQQAHRGHQNNLYFCVFEPEKEAQTDIRCKNE